MIGFPYGRLPSAGDVFPGFFLIQENNARTSIFVDESGSDGLSDRHYLLTVVMHDQSDSIADSIEAYESALRTKGLPDIPFHASPLMNSKDQYSGLDLRTRKMLLGSFRVFFRPCP